MSLSTTFEIRNPVNHGITRLDIDRHEHNLLLAGSSNGNVLLYNLANSEQGGTFSPLKWKSGHRGVVTNVQWYHNDNGACITSSFDGRVLVWDTGSFEVAAEFALSDKVYCSALRADAANNLIAIGTGTNSVRLCDLNTGDMSHTLAHTSAVFCLDWSPQGGHILATGTLEGAVKVWDIRMSGHGALISLDWQQDHTVASRAFAGEGLNTLTFRAPEPAKASVARAHTSSALAIKYSSCGNFLMSAGKDRKLRRWNAHDGSLYPTQFDHGCARTTLPYQVDLLRSGHSSTGDVLLCPGEDNSMLMYPLHPSKGGDGEAMNVLQGHVNPVRAAVFRDNGTYQVVSASSDGMLLAWDCAGTCKRRMSELRAQDEEAERFSRERHAADHLGLSLLARRTGLSSVGEVLKRKNPLEDDCWSDDDESEEVAQRLRSRQWGGTSVRAPLLVAPGGLLQSRFPDSDVDAGSVAAQHASSAGSSQTPGTAPSGDHQESSDIIAALNDMPSYLGALAGDDSMGPNDVPQQASGMRPTQRTLTIGGKRYRIRLRTHAQTSGGSRGGEEDTEDLEPTHPVIRPLSDAETFERINRLQKRRRLEKKDVIVQMKARMFPDKYK